MRRVSVRKLKNKATKLLTSHEPFLVERHGKVIGYYTPFKKDKQKVKEAADRLAETMRRAAEEAGMTVEELEELLVGDLP